MRQLQALDDFSSAADKGGNKQISENEWTDERINNWKMNAKAQLMRWTNSNAFRLFTKKISLDKISYFRYGILLWCNVIASIPWVIMSQLYTEDGATI